jgi:hypothetical protein
MDEGFYVSERVQNRAEKDRVICWPLGVADDESQPLNVSSPLVVSARRGRVLVGLRGTSEPNHHNSSPLSASAAGG